MVKPTKTHLSWLTYMQKVAQEVRNTYNTKDERVEITTTANITKIWVYTDKDRKTELASLLNNSASLLYNKSTDTLSYGRASFPKLENKISSVGIIEVTSYAEKSKKIQIIFKPVSSYFGGRGKINEKNFIEGMMKAKGFKNPHHDYVTVRFRDNHTPQTEYSIDIHSTTTISDISAVTGKGDVRMGNQKISLKMPSADFVSSLNAHPKYIEMGHSMLIHIADKIVYKGDSIYLNVFPFYKITDMNEKKELLFSSGRSIDAGSREMTPSSYEADVVIIHDFSEQRVKLNQSLIEGESHILDVQVTRIITKDNIRVLTENDEFDIHLFIRNAKEKGQPFGNTIDSKEKFTEWLKNKDNAAKIPKGVRLTSVFAKKNKDNKDHIEIKIINT